MKEKKLDPIVLPSGAEIPRKRVGNRIVTGPILPELKDEYGKYVFDRGNAAARYLFGKD